MNLSAVFVVVIPILLLSHQASSAALNAEKEDDASVTLGDGILKQIEKGCREGECMGHPDCDWQGCFVVETAYQRCKLVCKDEDYYEYDENGNNCVDRCSGRAICKDDCDREHDDPADQAKCFQECASDY